MRNFTIPLLITGLLFLAAFSLVMINHADSQSHNECPLKTVGTIDCTQVQNLIDFAVSHLNALSKFSLAIPINNFSSLISIFLLLAIAVFIIFNKEFELFKLKPLFARNRLREAFVPRNRILLSNWFSLHENSPTAS